MRARPLPPGQAQRDPASLPGGSLGSWLRQQREARGISLVEIADTSKIGRRYLEALESDRWDLLPAPVFTRGFLREYARIVGLDQDETINLYWIATQARQAPGSPGRVPGEPEEATSPKFWSRLGYGWILAAAVVVFLLLAFLLAKRSASLPPPGEPSEFLEAEPQAVTDTGVSVETARERLPEAAASRLEDAERPGLQVEIAFSGDCWVEALVDGKRRLAELKIAGETLEIRAASSVELTLGNRDAANVRVGGQPYELPRSPTRVLRGVRIEAGTLAAASPPPGAP